MLDQNFDHDNEIPNLVKEAIKTSRRLEHRLKEQDRRYGLATYIEGYTETQAYNLTPSPEQMVMRKLEVHLLLDAMRKLPLLQRKRIYAYYFLERSMTHIALEEGVSIAAVSKSIQLGLQNLRRFMEEAEK